MWLRKRPLGKRCLKPCWKLLQQVSVARGSLRPPPCLPACRLIALPSGYHLATVDAVRELLSVQAQTVGTRMRPAQYGASPDWPVKACHGMFNFQA